MHPQQGPPQGFHPQQPPQQQPLLPHPNMQQAPLLPHPSQQQFVAAPPGFQPQQGGPPPHFMQSPPHPSNSASSSSNVLPFYQQPPPQPQPVEHDPFLAHVVSASLVDLLGKQILVLLRDGRKLIGELLSFDQYSNIVISGASERKVIGNVYYDEPLGLYVIRGENVVLLGDQHPNRLAKHSPPIEFKSVSKSEFAVLEAEEKKKLEAAGFKASHILKGGDDDDLM